jgi:DNA-binding CsgD family transcriptional regulator
MERLHMNDIQEIIYRIRKGQSLEGIHRDTGHARKTIRKYRKLAQEKTAFSRRTEHYLLLAS